MVDGGPWSDLAQTWYAALVAEGHHIYGVARRTPPDQYEVLDKGTGGWLPTAEGLGYFSGIGGITDAVPVTEDVALELIAQLTGVGVGVRPVNEARFDPVIERAMGAPMRSQEPRNRR